MKIKLLKINLSNLVLVYLTFLGMFAGYIEHMKIFRMITIGVFALTAVLSSSNNKGLFRHRSFIAIFSCSVIMLFLNIMYSDTKGYLTENTLTLLYSLSIALTIFMLVQNENKVVRSFLEAAWPVLNLFWIFTLVVLFIQIMGTPLFIKQDWLMRNSYYPDLCCGIFGYNRTHQMSFFSCFITVLNLLTADSTFAEDKTKRRGLLIYTYATAILMLLMSTRNDNLALLVILPVTVVLYYRYRMKRGTLKKRLLGMMKYIVAGAFLIAVLAVATPLGAFISETVIERFTMVLYFDQYSVGGANERLAIASYSLSQGSTWQFGRGIGCNPWVAEDVLGFIHYGLSSIGSFLDLMGIWFYIFYCALFGIIMSISTQISQKRNPLAEFLICFVIVFFITIYTNLFTSEVSVLWMLMTFSVFGLIKPAAQKEKTNEENDFHKSKRYYKKALR